MPTPSEFADTLTRARRLRAAAAQVERSAPECADKADVLRRLDLLATKMERLDTERICRRCGQKFVFSAAWFELRGLTLPRHCPACRGARKAERRRAGALENVPPESG